MAITVLPTAPDPNDPSTFNARAAAWVAALPNLIAQLNAFANFSDGAVIQGRVTGAAVTQSSMDATLGKLTKTGDFGIGCIAQCPRVDDLDMDTETLPTGFYSGTGWLNGPTGTPLVSIWAVVHIQTLGSDGLNYRKQTCYLGASGPSNICYSRTRVAGVWRRWVKHFDTGNILGSVSTDVTGPTGAIIERGSNSNGYYTKFADGTMFCSKVNVSVPSISTPINGFFKSSSVSWTFPVAFLAGIPPVVLGQSDQTGRWIGVGGPSINGVNVQSYAETAAAAPVDLRLFAYGRWF